MIISPSRSTSDAFPACRAGLQTAPRGFVRLPMLVLSLATLLLASGCGGSSSSSSSGNGGGNGGADTLEVLTSTSGNGGIEPASVELEEGETAEFTLDPAEDHYIKTASGCGGQLENLTYETGEISESCTVVVEFAASTSASATRSEVTFHWDVETFTDQVDLCIAPERPQDMDNCSTVGGSIESGSGGSHTFSGLDEHHPYFVLLEDENDQESDPVVLVTSHGLNDTGIDFCEDNDGTAQGCPVTGYPGQDGEEGRDALARDGDLPDKVGDGVAGFDYSRICGNGDIDGEGCNLGTDPALHVGDGDDEWACTRDNVTGLTWEVKVDDEDHLRHMGHTYSWYNPDDSTNGGSAGYENGSDIIVGAECEGDKCNTQEYVEAVNDLELCGHDDWRLPTLVDLHSLANLGERIPAIDENYFPNTEDELHEDGVWSVSPIAYDSLGAWQLGFRTGGAVTGNKGLGDDRVRLVRGEQ